MATEGTGKAVSADLGQTFKISPGVIIAKKSTFAVCDIKSSDELFCKGFARRSGFKASSQSFFTTSRIFRPSVCRSVNCSRSAAFVYLKKITDVKNYYKQGE